MILIGFVILGSINYGLMIFGYNLIEMGNTKINEYINKKSYFNTIICAIIAISGLILMTRVSTWLPFLGPCAFPSKGLIPNKINLIGTKEIFVRVKPNTRVAYWSSLLLENDKIPDVEDAYDDFRNSGVVTSDDNGVAILLISPGSSYIVPTNKEIKKHVHYRELDLDYGMMGELKTLYY
jgi:hypothetical protein